MQHTSSLVLYNIKGYRTLLLVAMIVCCVCGQCVCVEATKVLASLPLVRSGPKPLPVTSAAVTPCPVFPFVPAVSPLNHHHLPTPPLPPP